MWSLIRSIGASVLRFDEAARSAAAAEADPRRYVTRTRETADVTACIRPQRDDEAPLLGEQAA